jgi:UDP-N-acetylglucosamine 1-carboxyvinyltransferase
VPGHGAAAGQRDWVYDNRAIYLTELNRLGAHVTSVLRNVYVINRGYEDLAERLNSIGAQTETFRDI